jgi:hypothetical protein
MNWLRYMEKDHFQQILVKILASGAICFAALGLLGYLPGLRALGSVSANFIPMAPSTSVSFISLSLILFFYEKLTSKTHLQTISIIIIFLTSAFGLLEFIGYYVDMDLTGSITRFSTNIYEISSK